MNTINAEEILIPLIKCRCRSFSRIFPAQTQSPIQTRRHLATNDESSPPSLDPLEHGWMRDTVTNLEFLFTLYKVKTRPNPMKGGVTMCRRAPRA